MSKLTPLNRRGRRKRLVSGMQLFHNPTADCYAICQGCGMPTMQSDIRERMEYRGGMAPVGTGLYVCGSCDDQPQPFFRLQVLRPDPDPNDVPRPLPDINQDPVVLLELDNGSVLELDNGALLELDDGDFPEYWL